MRVEELSHQFKRRFFGPNRAASLDKCSCFVRSAPVAGGEASMVGIVHLRVVVTIFVIWGILSILPYALSFLVDDEQAFPFGWVSGVTCIALAVWFSRGSKIARYLLIVLSIIGLLYYGLYFFAVVGDSWSNAAPLGIFGILSGYCLWLLTLSKELRAELSRRRDANAK
jgi:hypothetical protein